jgi:hypothetical protein
MARPATVYQLLVASPSDVPEERQAVRDLVQEWNVFHGASRRMLLEPVMWETHSVPEFGERPQAILNRQLVDSCDALIGIFWTRLGSPSGEAPSGTVEEINRIHGASKPVLLYFRSQRNLPENVDQAQVEALSKFKALCKANSLFHEYDTLSEFAVKVRLGLVRLSDRFDGASVSHMQVDATRDVDNQRTRWRRLLTDAATRSTNVSIDSPVLVELQDPSGLAEPRRLRARLDGLIRVAQPTEDTFMLSIPFERLGLVGLAVPYGQTEDIWMGTEGYLHVMLRRSIVRSIAGVHLR